MPKELLDLQLVPYVTPAGAVAKGLNAELIPEICEVWLKARAAGELSEAQQDAGDVAERGFVLGALEDDQERLRAAPTPPLSPAGRLPTTRGDVPPRPDRATLHLAASAAPIDQAGVRSPGSFFASPLGVLDSLARFVHPPPSRRCEMPTKAEYEGRGLKKLKKEAAKRSLRVTGTGPNGRVLIADLADALAKDDAKTTSREPEEVSQAQPQPPTADIEANEPVDTETPAASEPEPKVAKPETSKSEPAKSDAKSERMPKVGDVVSYRDEFSGQRSDARVSAVHDSRTVSLAIFRKTGTADPKTNVSFGHDRGSWNWKD